MPTNIKSISFTPELSSETTDYLIGGITNKMVATIRCRAQWQAAAGASADDQDMDFDANTKTITWNGGNFRSEGFYDIDTINIRGTSSNNGNYTITDINDVGDVITLAETVADETSETAIIVGTVECTGVRFNYNLIENESTPDYNSLIDENELKFTKAEIDYTSTTPVSLIQQGVYKSNHQGSATIEGIGTITAAGSGAGGSGNMTFVASTEKITWNSGGDFEDLGFEIGDTITVAGTSSNNGDYVILAVDGAVITVESGLTDEATVANAVVTTEHLNEFIITHTFYVTPFFLVEQLADIQNDIAPEYYFNDACLAYAYNIDLLYDLSDQNRVHTSDVDPLIGNTGWFNENFNGGLPKFSIDSLTYSIDGDTVTQPDFNQVTDVEIVINSEDSVFSNNNTEFILNHFILPETEAQYINTSTDVDTNFMFDRAKQTVGSAAVNGDQFGGAGQVLKDISATFDSASQITINAKIDLSSAYKSIIDDLSNRRFVLCVATQDHTKATEESDLVVLFDDVDSYTTDLSNDDVADIDTTLTQYPGNADCPQSMYVEDMLQASSIILLDTANGAQINNISAIIRAEKTDGSSFELERQNFSFSGAVVQNGVQQINIEEERGFILGANNPFKDVTLKRRSDLDTGDVYGYELVYSFKIRWEDFIQLLGVNSDFYDITEKFDGFNHDWNRYFTGSGWSIKYVCRAEIEENDFVNELEDERTLSAWTYDDSAYWTQLIRTYDIDTDDEITGYVFTDEVVRLEVEFTKNVGDIPDLTDVEGMIEVEPYEEGGINVIRNISTFYEHEDDSPFISLTGDKLLKKEKNGNTYKFSCNIDGSKLTGTPKITARIYDFTCDPPETCEKEFQDGEDFDFQDAVGYEFQDDAACDDVFLLDSIPDALYAFGTYILKTGVTLWGDYSLDSILGGGTILPPYIPELQDQSGGSITCIGYDNPPTPARETNPEYSNQMAKFETTKYFDVLTGAGVGSGDDFSLYFTIKGDDLSSFNQNILNFTDSSIVVSIGNSSISVSYNSGADTLTKTGLSNDTEYKVLIERDGSDVNLVIDGTQEDTSNTGTSFAVDSEAVFGITAGSKSIKSRALIFWEKVLSASEKTELFS